MKFLRKHLFLTLSLSAMLLGIANYWLFDRNAIGLTEQWYISTVRDKIQEEVKAAREDLFRAKIAIERSKKYSFSALQVSPATLNPYYVFRNKNLIFWSDSRFVPPYESIRNIKNAQLATYEHGQYIVTKWQFLKNRDSIEVVSLIPIYKRYKTENDYLKTGYNPDIFPADPLRVSPALLEQPRQLQNIYDDANNFLFSVSPPLKKINQNRHIPTNTVIFSVLTILFLGLYILFSAFQLHRQRNYELGFLLIISFITLIRGLLLYYGIPFLFFEIDFFNPKYFAASEISPSLGDLLINLLLGIFIASYFIFNFFRSKTYFKLIQSKAVVKASVSVGLIALSFCGFVWYYKLLEGIYQHSQYSLDISLSLPVSNLKIISLIVFVVGSCLYFLVCHFVIYLFVRLQRNELRKGLIIIASTALVATLALLFISQTSITVLLFLHACYLIVLFAFKLPRFLYSFRYSTSVYFFLGALVAASTAAFLIYQQELKKDFSQKFDFGTRYLAENDLLGEGLLAKVNTNIKADSAILQTLRGNFLVREQIQQVIKNEHLDSYFNKYDVEVLVFNSNGKSVDGFEASKDFAHYSELYRKDSYKTDVPDIYFVNDIGNDFIKQYVTFCELKSGNNLLGYIVMDLKMRDFNAEKVYPDLLKEKKPIKEPESQEYSYIIYDTNKKVLYRGGDFNYEKNITQPVLKLQELYTEGININKFRHVGVKGSNNRTIVVSSKTDSFQRIFANFSFLFLLFVVFIILLIIGYAIRYGFSKMNINFATKIQIYLNAAFLLPLLLVVVITLGVINTTFINNQEKAYTDNTKNIASNVVTHLLAKQNNQISTGILEQEVNRIASDSKTDISIFSADGTLNITTQPLIYEYNLLSRHINPEAYKTIIEDRESEKLLGETLGELSYKTAYIGLKAPNGQLLGVLGVPFFDSKPNLDQQIIEVIASILSIFALMFLLLLVLSFFASNVLTVPLRIFAQKIKRTNLDKLNEPLQWKSDDEIGLLIGEYNRMLIKLGENKIALAQSEKQSAWREMAKQVAHEIKNPLTPMKLSIQQLQRTLPTDNPKTKTIMERALKSLIEQIDNISDIATSFSDFANMPVPRNERFDLISVINSAAALYSDDDYISLNPYIKEKEAFVIGDRQLISRIVTNLIINGIQSVPATRKPIINLRIYRNDEHYVIIEVQDNGSGVPENIRNKVFMPNFSTKQGGSGLGLAMAKRGIEHAGGNIWFETSNGKGTTFFIDLPLSDK